MPWAQYEDQKVLDLLFSNTAYTIPGTWYVGLSIQTLAGATQANVLLGEPTSAGNYGRIAVVNNGTNWAASSFSGGTATKLLQTVQAFAQSSAAWSSGAANQILLFLADAATLAGGNVFGWGALGTPQAVASANITLQFAANALSVTLT